MDCCDSSEERTTHPSQVQYRQPSPHPARNFESFSKICGPVLRVRERTTTIPPQSSEISAISRMFDDDASVTRLYLELREGREEAATDLWQLCCQALVREARKQLGPNERRASDEEDVALAVFHELCQAVSNGRLSDDLRREDLTKLLRHFTRQETLDQRRHAQRAKRGGGIVRGDSIFAMHSDRHSANEGFHSVASPEPAPELMIQLDDQLQRLLASLDDDRLRQVALSVLAGDSRPETAEKLGLSLRSVERKVALIREAWRSELEAG